MLEPMNGRAFMLEMSDIIGISGNFDCDESIRPDMMPRAPDFAKGAGPELLLEDVF
jgi:hypothetical protein